jgi:cysteine desulfuration protein SufE
MSQCQLPSTSLGTIDRLGAPTSLPTSEGDESGRHHYLHGMTALNDVFADYELLEADDRYRLLIDLGRSLEPMPDALKTDATLVRGCSASVWLYPVERSDGTLHFLADSNAAITKGIVALVLLTVQDQSAEEILATNIEEALAPFDLKNQLSSNRTQGIPNMIALIRQTAERLNG